MTLIQIRRANKISQSKLAEMCGVTQTTISYIEKGKREPSPKLANKLAKIFNLSDEEAWKTFYKR